MDKATRDPVNRYGFARDEAARHRAIESFGLLTNRPLFFGEGNDPVNGYTHCVRDEAARRRH